MSLSLSITIPGFLSALSFLALGAAPMRTYQVRHLSPAASWTAADPLGNGRLGAMVRGGTRDEVIHLNEDTLWSGEPPVHFDGTKCREYLDEIRKLIFAGRHQEATALGQKTMLGVNNQCYLPLGNLRITMPGVEAAAVTGYDRALDLNRALSVTRFRHGGVDFERSVFVSHPDQAFIVRLTASKPGAIDADVSLDSLLEHSVEADPDGRRLWMTGRAPIHADPHYQGTRVEYDNTPARRGMRHASVLGAEATGGTVSGKDGELQVRGADQLVLKLAAATSFNGFTKSPSAEGRDEKWLAAAALEKIGAAGFDDLLERHVADHARWFGRVDLQLGDGDRQGKAVSGRIGPAHRPGEDPDLDELFYQFGRYLLIASSRAGSQPANLQGIWSYKMNPSWSSNWTMNCNAQFNYIGAGAAGLAELSEPFRRMVRETSVDGARVARSWYGSQGWVFHHNIDLWRMANPSGGNVMWASFPMAGAWSAVELFDLWRFGGDTEELKRLWPLLRGNAEFWLGNLVRDPDSGKLVSCPDVYFENTGRKPDGSTVLLCSAPVSSTIMIRQSFLDLLEAARLLGIENDPLLGRVATALGEMPGLEINRHGEIRQWDRDRGDEWKEGDPTQLLVMNGVIYSNQISGRKSPELAKALALMLNRRKLGLGGEGSWRAAFPGNSYARLGDGNACHRVLEAFYRKWANPNLTARFIQADWEIDGNLGLMSAIQECLVQSHDGEVELLPALPDAWKARGSVRGMRIRGGSSVDFEWKDSKVTRWAFTGPPPAKLRVNGELRNAGEGA